jgi:hypothetical protein
MMNYDHHRPSKIAGFGAPLCIHGDVWDMASPTSQHKNLGTMVNENKKSVGKSFYWLVVWNICYFP